MIRLKDKQFLLNFIGQFTKLFQLKFAIRYYKLSLTFTPQHLKSLNNTIFKQKSQIQNTIKLNQIKKLKMIKSNRFTDDLVINSEYTNRLRQYQQTLQQSKSSQSSQTITQKTKKQPSKIVDEDEIKSSKSKTSKRTSLQRAFNSRVTTQLLKEENNIIPKQNNIRRIFSLQQQNRQNKNFIQQNQPRERDQSDILKTDKSESSGDIKAQLERLNSLREQYEILRQVSSDIEYQQREESFIKESISKNQQKLQNKRKQNYQSGGPIAVQVKRSKKTSKESRIKKNITYQNVYIDKSPESENKRISQDHQNNNITSSSQQNEIQQQSRQRTIRPQTHQAFEQTNQNKSQILSGNDSRLILSQNQELINQVSSLQLALTQSTLKIEELLMEGIRNKDKFKQSQQYIQKNHRLQNQLKLSKQTQKFLKRQIHLKEDEVSRFEKRAKLMKDTIQMLQQQNQVKDKQIKALQNVIDKYRNKSNHTNTTQMNLHPLNNLNACSTKNLVQNQHPQTGNEILENFKLITEQNGFLKAQLQQQQSRIQLFTQQLKKSTIDDTHHIKSYFTQTNNHLKQLLEKSQEELYYVQSQNKKLLSQLKAQQSKNLELKEELSNKQLQIVSLTQSRGNMVNQSQNQSRLTRQIQKIQSQILKLQPSTNTNQSTYINQLELKLRQLEELIHEENHQKKQFAHQIHKFKKQQIKILQQNSLLNQKSISLNQEKNQLKKDNLQLSKENTEIKKQLHEISRENHNLNRQIQSLTISNVQLTTELKFTNQNQNNLFIQLEQLRKTSVPKDQFNYLQKQKGRISQQLDRAQYQKITLNSYEDQKLLANLNSIKEEYLKLQEAYMQKAKEAESLKVQLLKINQQLKLLEKENQFLQNEFNQEKKYCQELQNKFQEKELKMIELMNEAQSKTAYANKLSQLQEKVSVLELELKQKDHLVKQLEIKNKKFIHEQKAAENQLKIQISQLKIQKMNFKTSLQQQAKQFNHQIENYKKQIQIKSDQLKQLENHYNEVNKIDKQMMEKQVKILENQLFQVIREKEKLMEQNIKIAHLEYRLKQMGVKQKKSRKITQNIDHLWMIKEAQYWNINQILKMFNASSKYSTPGNQEDL